MKLFNKKLILTALLFSMPFLGAVNAGELSGQEVKQLVSGNTVEAVHAQKGYPITTYHLTNGTYRQIRDGERVSGTWRVDKQGFLCTNRDGWGEACRLIVQDGDVWNAYKIPDNPMKGRKHERTFKKIVEGNPNNL